MKYAVVIEKGPTSYGAYVPDLPGCGVAGSSKEEVLRLIKEAVVLHVEGMKEQGLAIPRASTIEFVDVEAA
jgi:predicted RNase H-like HicB family nuclease